MKEVIENIALNSNFDVTSEVNCALQKWRLKLRCIENNALDPNRVSFKDRLFSVLCAFFPNLFLPKPSRRRFLYKPKVL